MQEAEHDDGCASELEEPSLESTGRKTRYRRQRQQCRKRAERKGEHSQGAGREISLCKNIQLKRLREPAGQKEGGRAEYTKPPPFVSPSARPRTRSASASATPR